MKIISRRALTFALAITLLLCMSFPVAASANDISGHWAQNVITKWVDKGIVEGFSDGSFKPNDPITKAQLAYMLNNIFGFADKADNSFKDVKGDEWYADALLKCLKAGIVDGNPDGTFKPDSKVTREQAARMIATAFDLKAKNANAINAFSDGASVASWAKSYTSALYEKGYISGVTPKAFAPKKNLTRAEMLTIVDNILSDVKNASGTYNGSVAKSLLVSTKDVTLKDMVIDGDLYLAQGIGEGDVTLDNVTVKGRVVVKGGGENSIKLVNTTITGSLYIIKQNGKVRVVASGTTSVPEVIAGSGAKLQEAGLTGTGFGKVEIIEFKAGDTLTLEGNFESIDISAQNVKLDVASGSVGSITVANSAANATINIASGATVGTFTANAKANVTGKGLIQKAVINADGVQMETAPASIIVASSVKQPPVVAGVIVPAGTDTTKTSASNGGSSTTPTNPSNPAKTISVSDMKLVDSDGTLRGLDLSGVADDGIRIKGFRATSNVASVEAVIESITSPLTGTMTVGIKRSFSSSTVDLGISDIWPPYIASREDVSIGGMKQVFGEYVTVNVTIKGTGSYTDYQALSTSIRVKLSDDNVSSSLPAISDWATLSYDAGTKTLTANLKDDKQNLKFSTYKGAAMELFLNMAGTLNQYVGIGSDLSISIDDGNTWYNNPQDLSQRAGLKSDLLSKWSLDTSNDTFSALAGHTLTCKYGSNNTKYYVKIVA